MSYKASYNVTDVADFTFKKRKSLVPEIMCTQPIIFCVGMLTLNDVYHALIHFSWLEQLSQESSNVCS